MDQSWHLGCRKNTYNGPSLKPKSGVGALGIPRKRRHVKEGMWDGSGSANKLENRQCKQDKIMSANRVEKRQ